MALSSAPIKKQLRVDTNNEKPDYMIKRGEGKSNTFKDEFVGKSPILNLTSPSAGNKDWSRRTDLRKALLSV
jgi:hypothetical protein